MLCNEGVIRRKHTWMRMEGRMDAAVLDNAGGVPGLVAGSSPRAKLDRDRLRDMVLLRLAAAGKTVAREAIAKEFAPLAAHLVAADEWTSIIERDLAALADAGLADVKTVGVDTTEAGIKRAAIVLGGRGAFPKSWSEARDVRLVAKALDLDREPPAKLKKLAKPDGLRAAILIKAFDLKIRGAASPVRLRTALAKVALARAFGNDDGGSEDSKTGLSAKDGRALASRLGREPVKYRTDARLVAGLAADFVGATKTDMGAMQTAILRRYLTKGDVAPPASKPKRRLKLVPKPVAVPPPQETHPLTQVIPPVQGRPSLETFVVDVLRLAAPRAEGFVGNRKAFISRLWRSIETERAHWGLSEVEFKCMLTEAHRLGQLILANADLRDDRNLDDVQRSAVSYRNAVFHYVRVDV
jgi:hypothetical protein